MPLLNVEANSADHAWRQSVKIIVEQGTTVSSRIEDTKELHPAFLLVKDPRQRVVFGRPINPAFALAEVIWILSGGSKASFLTFWNSRMRQYLEVGSDEFHGAYGARLGSRPKLSKNADQFFRSTPRGEDQLKSAVNLLSSKNKKSDITLNIWDSKLDLPDPQPRSKDVPCNIQAMLLLRNNSLHWTQVMRSNDIVWGTPYNFIQFMSLQEIMAGWIGVNIGIYQHVASSLHAYKKHWTGLLKVDTTTTLTPTNVVDLRKDKAGQLLGYPAWEAMWEDLVDRAHQITKTKNTDDLHHLYKSAMDLPDGYRQWLSVLTAEALRKRGASQLGREIISEAGQFWSTSWLQWADTTASMTK